MRETGGEAALLLQRDATCAFIHLLEDTGWLGGWLLPSHSSNGKKEEERVPGRVKDQSAVPVAVSGTGGEVGILERDPHDGELEVEVAVETDSD